MAGFIVAFILSYGFGLLYSMFVYWLDRYEKEPKLLVGGVFIWGSTVAVIGALVIELIIGAGSSIFLGSGLLNDLFSGSVSAPLAEEALKSAAVLLVFLLFYKEFDSVLDGIVYAAITALGFAAAENLLYLFSTYTEEGWQGLFILFGLRVIVGAWAHPLYTALFGIGLAMARNTRNIAIKIFAPLLGLAMGMFLHGFDNGVLIVGNDLWALLLATAVEWLGWIFIIGVAFWALWREGSWIKQYLREEVELGLISQAQYQTASSVWQQFSSSFRALTSGKMLATGRFYQVCGDLAHKKRQMATLGEVSHQKDIDKLRAELASLASQASA